MALNLFCKYCGRELKSCNGNIGQTMQCSFCHSPIELLKPLNKNQSKVFKFQFLIGASFILILIIFFNDNIISSLRRSLSNSTLIPKSPTDHTANTPLYDTNSFDGCMALAKNGDAKAQYLISGFYNDGIGVEKDYSKANKWLFESAKNGYPEAEGVVAVLCFHGLPDGSKFPKEGLEWFRKAIDHGNARAETILGIMYYKGIGINKNIEAGLILLRKAALQNDAEAIELLKDESKLN